MDVHMGGLALMLATVIPFRRREPPPVLALDPPTLELPAIEAAPVPAAPATPEPVLEDEYEYLEECLAARGLSLAAVQNKGDFKLRLSPDEAAANFVAWMRAHGFDGWWVADQVHELYKFHCADQYATRVGGRRVTVPQLVEIDRIIFMRALAHARGVTPSRQRIGNAPAFADLRARLDREGRSYGRESLYHFDSIEAASRPEDSDADLPLFAALVKLAA